jgi:transcriptional regulator with XRE-family HTH domain
LARARREYLGLTQKKVAGKMGITQAALSQMESSKKSCAKRHWKSLRQRWVLMLNN